jgi:hypothetical protein
MQIIIAYLYLYTLWIVVNSRYEYEIAWFDVFKFFYGARQSVVHVGLVAGAYSKTKLALQVSHHASNETTAVQKQVGIILGSFFLNI